MTTLYRHVSNLIECLLQRGRLRITVGLAGPGVGRDLLPKKLLSRINRLAGNYHFQRHADSEGLFRLCSLKRGPLTLEERGFRDQAAIVMLASQCAWLSPIGLRKTS